jgi:hypothetical protein
VIFSKTGRTLRYAGREFRSLKGDYKRNHFDVAKGETFWNSGPKKRGGDRLYNCNLRIEIDADVREEYWRDIRGEPERPAEAATF